VIPLRNRKMNERSRAMIIDIRNVTLYLLSVVCVSIGTGYCSDGDLIISLDIKKYFQAIFIWF
jgi:hypothetical protein